MGLLYAGLEPAEAGRIGQRLDELKVTYEARGDGTSIMVPYSQIARVRMELAASGMPHQGGAGYELLDQQSPMNMTSFMQRVQRLRALEGELARTIVTLNGVRSARVHIVMPERETFARETPKPTASVAVVMNGPARLGASEAAAIRLLVAGAVPELRQDDVSVLDPSGIVMAADGAEVMASARLTELKSGRERALERAITKLLEPLVGYGKVKAIASADIDTSREVVRDEKFDPRSQVERSKQTQVDRDNSEETRPRDPVSVNQNLPNNNQQQQAAASPTPKSSSASTRNGETINYEISSTRTEKVREPGELRRLTIAVVVDGTVDDKGVFQPRSKQDLDRFTNLVQSAVGFDAKRGDKVTVDTMRFLPAEEFGSGAEAASPFMSTHWVWIGIEVLLAVLLAAAALILMMRTRHRVELARQSEAQALVVAQSGEATAVLQDETARAAAMPDNEHEAFLGPLFDIVDERPDEALAVLKAWIAGGTA